MRQPKEKLSNHPRIMPIDKELTPLTKGNCLSIRNVHLGSRPNQVHIYGIYILVVQVLLNVHKKLQNKENNRLVLQRLVHQRGMSYTAIWVYDQHLSLRLEEHEQKSWKLRRRIHRRGMFCTGDQSPINVIIRLAGWSWRRRRRHIRTTTPEVAGPPENSIYSSYTSDMTKLALARDHPHPSEGATGPWPTYMTLPELLTAPATSRRLLFPETTTVQCPSHHWERHSM